MNDSKTANAQIGLALIYALGFFGILCVFIFFSTDVSETTKGMLLTLIGALAALVQQQSSYFFARQRPDSQALNTTTTTQVTTESVPPTTPTTETKT